MCSSKRALHDRDRAQVSTAQAHAAAAAIGELRVHDGVTAHHGLRGCVGESSLLQQWAQAFEFFSSKQNEH